MSFYSRKVWSKIIVILVLVVLLTTPLLIIDTHPARADKEVGGPIMVNTTWTIANSPYIVVTSVDVMDGVTLTIEPGVVVKFNTNTKLQVNGELIAQGTSSNQIYFTSNQASPARGDWENIEFTSTSTPTTIDSNGNYISGSLLEY